VKEIYIRTMQGIGDTFWCFQKLLPYFDKINPIVLVDKHCKDMDPRGVVRRAESWLPLFPGCGKVSYEFADVNDEYLRIAGTTYSIQDLIDGYENGQRTFDYAMNNPLERGVMIEDVDPHHEIYYNLDVKNTPCPRAFEGSDYFVFYASGATGSKDVQKATGAWTLTKWKKLLEEAFQRMKLPCIFVGASYDSEVLHELKAYADMSGHKSHIYINSYPANVIWLLKNAKFYIGYQSGLSIMAENQLTPQIELIFNHYDLMPETWARPDGRKSRHNGFIFDTPFEEVAEAIPVF